MLELDKNSRQEKFENEKTYTYLNACGNTNDPNCVFCIEEGFKFYNLAQTTFAPEFENRVTLQSVNNILEYNPDYAVHLASPTAVLYIHATQDVIPIDMVREIYERTSEPKKFVEIDSLHVEVYTDEPYFTTAVTETIDWFDIHVKNAEENLTD